MTEGGRRVVLWRHGRTRWNVENRFQGRTDVDLDETGVAQAQRAARLLAALAPDAIVSSDLRRAADTASALSGLTRLEIAYDAGLRERGGGAWEGLTGAEIAQRFPESYAAWQAGEDVTPEGGEAYVDVAARAGAAVEKAMAGVRRGGTLVAVTHGGAARAAIGRLLGLPAQSWSALGALANCNWSVLAEDRRGWRLVEHNAGTLPEPVVGDDH